MLEDQPHSRQARGGYNLPLLDHGLLSWVGGSGKWSRSESDGPKEGGMSLALYLRYHCQVEVDSRP